jgi:hypothetical protein
MICFSSLWFVGGGGSFDVSGEKFSRDEGKQAVKKSRGFQQMTSFLFGEWEKLKD